MKLLISSYILTSPQITVPLLRLLLQTLKVVNKSQLHATCVTILKACKAGDDVDLITNDPYSDVV